jgi:hypothetical protein
MKICTLRSYTAAAVAGALFVSLTAAEEKPARPQAAAAPNMEEMMKKSEAFATPGSAHKALETLAGEWNVEARWWMAGPDGPPTVSKGTTQTRWILGGRFLQEDFTGEMMQKPFHGVGITGYDNFKKKYVSTWMDDMGTGIFISEGSADADGKVLTFLGKMDDPMTGQKDKPTKYIVRILTPDKHTFEMHDLTLGEKSKMGEMTYTRK